MKSVDSDEKSIGHNSDFGNFNPNLKLGDPFVGGDNLTPSAGRSGG